MIVGHGITNHFQKSSTIHNYKPPPVTFQLLIILLRRGDMHAVWENLTCDLLQASHADERLETKASIPIGGRPPPATISRERPLSFIRALTVLRGRKGNFEKQISKIFRRLFGGESPCAESLGMRP